MGGKGRKRREKNFIAAHGAPNRLPPPPAPSSIDAIPSKLRKLMSYAHSDTVNLSVDTAKKNSTGVEKQKNTGSEQKLDSKTREVKAKENDGVESYMGFDSADKGLEVEKKKKKRKRKQVDDLRFEGDLAGVGATRKEKKKLHRKERKLKKRKGKDEDDYPKHEYIKFGEVVKAPLKLVTAPMRPKPVHNASTERMRIQAVEAYRERRGWTSRPGLNLPPPDIPSLI